MYSDLVTDPDGTITRGTWNDFDCNYQCYSAVCSKPVSTAPTTCEKPPPTTPPPVTDCPCETGWTYFLGTDSCYKLDCNGTFNGTHVVNATGRTVYAARNSCLALGADLVSVHSPQEQALLYAVAGNVRDLGDYRESIWIGLYRTDVATQNWMWTDGTPYDAAYFVQRFGPNDRRNRTFLVVSYGSPQAKPLDYAPAAAFVPRYNGWQTTGGWHDISPDAAGWSDGGYKYAICKKKAKAVSG